MKLIITRHGETEENLSGILQGHMPGKLSKEGILQAKKLAKRLKDEKIDYIYSSDLKRTSDTAKEILRYHPKVPIEFVKELRERNFGEWQGKKCSDVFPKKGYDLKRSPIEGETIEELFNRTRNFLQKILLKHPNETILFAGHEGINKALVTAIKNKDYEHIKSIESFHNTSITIYEIDENKKHKNILFNCKKHLD